MLRKRTSASTLLVGSLLVAACDSERPVGPKDPEINPLGAATSQGVTTPGVLVPRWSTTPTSTAITPVAPATLTCTDVIDFEDVPGAGGAGFNVDGILASGAGSFAERFAGQTLSFGNSSSGGQPGDFDILSGTPNNPLTLQVGAAGENLSVLISGSDNVLTGLGPLGFPNFNSVGEGAVAGLFTANQFELGFTTVGAGGGGVPSATVNFFASDGSLIDTEVISPLTGSQTWAFRRAGNVRDIAGVSIHNDDPGGIGYDDIVICEVIEVGIDIKPGSFPNSINPKSMGLVPVAILGSADFDVTDVDVTTLTFGPDGAMPAHDLTDPLTYADHLQDVNMDGFTDLVSHYRQKETGLVPGDTEACIEGATNGGTPIEGCDSVNVLDPGA